MLVAVMYLTFPLYRFLVTNFLPAGGRCNDHQILSNVNWLLGVFSDRVSWKSQFDPERFSPVLQTLASDREKHRRAITSHRRPPGSRQETGLFLRSLSPGRENSKMSLCAFTSQGHLMQQISTSNQFIAEVLSKLL